MVYAVIISCMNAIINAGAKWELMLVDEFSFLLEQTKQKLRICIRSL